MKSEKIKYDSHEIPSDTGRFFSVILYDLVQQILEIELPGFLLIEELEFARKLLNVIAGI